MCISPWGCPHTHITCLCGTKYGACNDCQVPYCEACLDSKVKKTCRDENLFEQGLHLVAVHQLLPYLYLFSKLLAVQGSTAVRAPLQVAGQQWLVTCVSMGNPHAVVFGTTQGNLKVAFLCCLVHPTSTALSVSSHCSPFQQCSVVHEFKSSGATLAFVGTQASVGAACKILLDVGCYIEPQTCPGIPCKHHHNSMNTKQAHRTSDHMYTWQCAF